MHGVPLRGKVSKEYRIGRYLISIIFAPGKIYAICEGRSIVERQADIDMNELTELIQEELK